MYSFTKHSIQLCLVEVLGIMINEDYIDEDYMKINEDYIGAARGGNIGNVPPRNGTKCFRKMMLFPRALFLATTFLKIAKNSIFILNFYQNFAKTSQNSPTIFSSKRAKN